MILKTMNTNADIMFNGIMLEMFRPTSEVEVNELIIKSPNESCDLDPLRCLGDMGMIRKR